MLSDLVKSSRSPDGKYPIEVTCFYIDAVYPAHASFTASSASAPSALRTIESPHW